jgi:hypothetical protein
MSHPVNRRERFLLGLHKGEKRASGMFSSTFRREHPESYDKWARRYRNITKVCGKACCANPRHNGWNSGKDKLTRQEQKFIESCHYLGL